MRHATCDVRGDISTFRHAHVACRVSRVQNLTIGTPQHYSVPAKNRSMIAECSASFQPELSIDTQPL